MDRVRQSIICDTRAQILEQGSGDKGYCFVKFDEGPAALINHE